MLVLHKVQSQDQRLFELQLWAASNGITRWLADLCPYEQCRVAGLVDRLLIDPANRVIEACVNDGTGVVVAEWAIRHPTPQLSLTPGRAIVLEGVASVAMDGRLLMSEPSFEIASFPEVA